MNLQRVAALVLLTTGVASALAAPEREIPPAFGPYINLTAKDFAGARSFKSGDRIVGTYYFYWYCTETKEHIINPEDGSDAFTDHPPTLDGLSYKSVAWHKKQLSDMTQAGINVLLATFWGAPSGRDPQAALYWSYAGLGPLVQAREELLREGKHPPRLGLFYDTSTLQFNEWRTHIGLTTDYGRQYLELTRKYADLFKQGWSPPWPKGPFTGAKAVSATPCSTSASTGLCLVLVEDGTPELQRKDGESSWLAKPFPGRGSYIYFQVDDSFKWSRAMNATVTVEYQDAAPGWLGVEFDGGDLNAPVQGAYSRTSKVELKGDRQWKTEHFKVRGAFFTGAQNGGADFRLVPEAPEIAVRKVTVTCD